MLWELRPSTVNNLVVFNLNRNKPFLTAPFRLQRAIKSIYVQHSKNTYFGLELIVMER